MGMWIGKDSNPNGVVSGWGLGQGALAAIPCQVVFRPDQDVRTHPGSLTDTLEIGVDAVHEGQPAGLDDVVATRRRCPSCGGRRCESMSTRVRGGGAGACRR